MNIQKKEAKLVFEILNNNLDLKNSSGKKLKLFIDLIIPQVLTLPFFFQSSELQHIHY